MNGELLIPPTSFNEDLRERTKQAALRVIRLSERLPYCQEANVLGKQLLRSATSVTANFRACCRSRSPAEWYAKLCICVEEADETVFWLELLGDANIVAKARLINLENEYREIVAILASTRKKAKRRCSGEK